jgi:aromatic ring hydroxylase
MAEKSSGGARRGQQVLQRLREQPPSIWYRGELVKDVTLQVLYERFFFGDPVRMAGALVTGHAAQIQQHAEMVRAFVQEGKDEAFGRGFPN